VVVEHEGPESLSAATFVAMEDGSRRLDLRVDVATPAALPCRGGREIDDRHAGLPVSEVTNSHGDGRDRPYRTRDGYP
jgi:hypothetical protein